MQLQIDLPTFDKYIIGDYNVEGFDSVESEDFDPGFGCVFVINNPPCYLPPMPPSTLTENDRWNLEQSRLKLEEIQAREDEFLLRHGIKF